MIKLIKILSNVGYFIFKVALQNHQIPKKTSKKFSQHRFSIVKNFL